MHEDRVTVTDLLQALEACDPDAEVRIAQQPAWPFEYAIDPTNPGLAERSHRPRSCPHQIPAAVEARICELRRRHPDWGPRRLHHELGRDGVQPLPSRSASYRALVRQQLIEPVARRRRKADYL